MTTLRKVNNVEHTSTVASFDASYLVPAKPIAPSRFGDELSSGEFWKMIVRSPGSYSKSEHRSLYNALRDQNADDVKKLIAKKDKDGMNVLMHLASAKFDDSTNDNDVVKKIITKAQVSLEKEEFLALLNLRSSSGKTFADMAKLSGNKELMVYAIAAGTEFTLKADEKDLAYVAVFYREKKGSMKRVVESLLKNLNEAELVIILTDNTLLKGITSGTNIIALAASRNRIEIVEAIRERADKLINPTDLKRVLDTRNFESKTPIHVAQDSGNIHMAIYLDRWYTAILGAMPKAEPI